MVNLEELILFLSILRVDSTYIDGTQLYDDILIYMPCLNKFTFNIDACVLCKNTKITLPLNEDIQRSFIGRRYGEVDSYIETLPTKDESSCHIYSLPYQFKIFFCRSNSFQGGMFPHVRCLFMLNLRPFKRHFFNVISQNFPLLDKLYIHNDQPQTDKQQSTTFITFPHLILLDLSLAHVDYAEQFLSERNTHLPRLLDLKIRYESLAIVTNNFTNDATRLNCAKVTRLKIKEPFVRPEKFHQCFPLL
jgi:hypothetical protein